MYTLNMLIPFDLLIDLDLGLIKLLHFDYRNDEYFYTGILDGPDDCIRYELLMRKDPNPLIIAMKNTDDVETMDSLYSQFMEKEYSKILSLSKGTSLADLTKLSSYDSDKVIRITVLCRSKEEEEVIRSRNINPYNTIISNPKDINLSDYNCIYVKNISDLDLYRKVEGLTIFIPNYGFNLIQDPDNISPGLPMELVTKYASDNEIKIFTIYNLDPNEIPIG